MRVSRGTVFAKTRIWRGCVRDVRYTGAKQLIPGFAVGNTDFGAFQQLRRKCLNRKKLDRLTLAQCAPTQIGEHRTAGLKIALLGIISLTSNLTMKHCSSGSVL